MSGAPDFPTDDMIVAALGDGRRIHLICNALGITGTARARVSRRLKALERAGRVIRCARHSFANSYFWHAPGEPCRGCRI